eukprot:RCo049058
MARNQEKAQSMLNRWQQIKRDMEKGDVQLRPWNTAECRSVPEAERWRKEVIKEVSRKVAEIQNASLGEHRIRELNDEINKLLREKVRWERQILDLGGPNYLARAKKDVQFEGQEAQGSRGYKYFGAAKDLPGVRELFEKPVSGPAKRTRYEMHRGVTPDYYGYRDDDDGVLEKFERRAEQRIRKKVIEEWKLAQQKKLEGSTEGALPADDGGELLPSSVPEITTAEEKAGYSSLVTVPSQTQVAGSLIEAKKRRLLHRLGITTGAPGGSRKDGRSGEGDSAEAEDVVDEDSESDSGSEEEQERDGAPGETGGAKKPGASGK